MVWLKKTDVCIIIIVPDITISIWTTIIENDSLILTEKNDWNHVDVTFRITNT